jgi:hypothetical protein
VGSSPVNGAAFTTTNPNVDRPDGLPADRELCVHGQDPQAGANNCNLYASKEYVWFNGGPAAAQLSDGDYFFAVLAPGGQGGNRNPNDGTEKNLSDVSPTSGTPGGTVWTARTFHVANGQFTYTGNPALHLYDGVTQKIRLFPYDDSPNNGGVYILALCRIPDPISTTDAPGVNPSNCKYDAFKVRNGTGGEDESPDAFIEIVEDATNEVNDAHVFTITVTATGGKQPYTVGVTPSVSPAPDLGTSTTCSTGVALAAGADQYSCTFTINSSSAGAFTAGASATVTDANNKSANVSTGTTGQGDGAVKTYVDAKISVGQDGTNGIGEAHTVTGHVDVNPGTGWSFAPSGTVINFTIGSGPGALSAASCTTTDATGSCSVALNNPTTAGTTTVNASTTVTVGGLALARSTDGQAGNSGPLTKVWVAGSLSWYKDKSTTSMRLGGATFAVCRTADWSSASGSFGTPLYPPVCLSVLDNIGQPGYAGRDTDVGAGSFKVEGLVLGKYTLTETAAPLNWVLDPTPKSTPDGYLSTTQPNYTFSVAFVNTPKYQGETATGAGFPWSATQKAPANWFMYTPWETSTVNGAQKTGLSAMGTIALLAGQTLNAGTVDGVQDPSGNRSITISLNTNDHWRFAAGASNTVKIEVMSSCDSRQPYVQPGQFDIKVSPAAGQTVVTVSATSLSGALRTQFNAAKCYGIHADVERPLVW